MESGVTDSTATSTPAGSNFRGALIKIFLIEFNTRADQQLAQFLSERLHAVMFLLVLDVFNQTVFVGVRRCETAITLLPTFETWKQSFLLNPEARCDFDVFDEVANATEG